MLPAVGWTTASANAVATAASTAVPPSLIASAPMRDAMSFCEATIPFCARTGTEVAPMVTDNARAVIAAMKNLRVSIGKLYGRTLRRNVCHGINLDEQAVAGKRRDLNRGPSRP